MAQRIFALEIGASELKAAVVETSFRDYRVTGLFREPVVHDGGGADQVRRFIEQHTEAGDTVLSALPGDRVTWRTFFLPFRDRKRLERTIPFELESSVPFGLDEVVVDYQVLHRDKAGTTVLAALVPKAEVARHLELLQGAGADPKIVDLGPLATLNALSLVPDLPPTFAFLDCGLGITTVALYRNGELAGLRTLTRQSPAAAAHTNGSGGAAAESGVAELIGEVRWTLLALNGAPLDDDLPCYLAGEPAGLDVLERGLQSVVPGALHRLDRLQLRGMNGEAGGSASSFTSSLGLALREVAPSNALGVNFRRGEFTFHRSQQELRRALRGVAALAAVVLALTVADLFLEYRQMADRVAAIETQERKVFRATLPDVPASGDLRGQLQAEIDALRSRVTLLSDVVPVSTSTSVDVLRAIAAAIPPKTRVDCDEYTMDPDAVRIRANTETYDSVDAIKQELLNTGFFKDVQVKNAKAAKEGGGVDFQVTLDLAKTFGARKEHP